MSGCWWEGRHRPTLVSRSEAGAGVGAAVSSGVACLQMILGAIIAGILAANHRTLADNEPLNFTAVLGVTTTHYIDKLSFLPQKRRWRLERTIAEETK